MNDQNISLQTRWYRVIRPCMQWDVFYFCSLKKNNEEKRKVTMKNLTSSDIRQM